MGDVIDMRTRATLCAATKYPPDDLEEHCPNCEGIWWTVRATLLRDEDMPTVTGWRATVICESCGYEKTFPGGEDWDA